MNLEELQDEMLECARYGEAEDLSSILKANVNGVPVDVNYADKSGNTALHKSAANGHIDCMKILITHGIRYLLNKEGNSPLHWAIQNSQIEATKLLFHTFDTEVDVLQQNVVGKSALSEAFSTQIENLIELCLSHSSANEEKLMDTTRLNKGTTSFKISDETENSQSTGQDDNSANDKDHSVIHRMHFAEDIEIQIRELPIIGADHPFGSQEAPQDDTTGLGLWPASLILAKWMTQLTGFIENKVVMELGAGCGLPGIVTAIHCHPKAMILSDINDTSLTNAQYNVQLNSSNYQVINSHEESFNLLSNEEGTRCFVSVCKVNWMDPSTYPSAHPVDVFIGSDLVYDAQILTILISAIKIIIRPGGRFFYVAPDTGRDGMSLLINKLQEIGMELMSAQPAPHEMFQNPLIGNPDEDNDSYVLHFYDLAAKVPHTLYHFYMI